MKTYAVFLVKCLVRAIPYYFICAGFYMYIGWYILDNVKDTTTEDTNVGNKKYLGIYQTVNTITGTNNDIKQR